MVEKITEATFNLVTASGGPHDKNPQIIYKRNHPEEWRMIRPDRPYDLEAHSYADANAKAVGDAAMKRWFEYLAAKKWFRTLNTWRGIILSGKSIMVVTDDPGMFDPTFVWPLKSALPIDFWDEFQKSRNPIERRYEVR